MSPVLARLLAVSALLAAAGAGQPATGSPPVVNPNAPVACDFDENRHRGMEAADYGMHARALQQFELALRCKLDQEIIVRAAVAACDMGNTAKLQQHVARMTFVDKLQFLARSQCYLDGTRRP